MHFISAYIHKHTGIFSAKLVLKLVFNTTLDYRKKNRHEIITSREPFHINAFSGNKCPNDYTIVSLKQDLMDKKATRGSRWTVVK